MNTISVDLPWNPDNKGRTALAVTDLDGNIKVMRANDENEMLRLITENVEQKSRILLDIPIEGCEELLKKNKYFRPVEKALLRQKISIQPTLKKDKNKNKYKDRGKGLKKRIQSINKRKRVIVQEIYPYAIYKFLAYLKDRNLLQRLNVDKFDTLLDEGFRRTYRPPKYKRQKKKDERLKDMEYLYSLLTDRDIGLNFRIPLNYPDASSNLSQLSDEYDACLGAIVGIYFANNSGYACLAGDSNSGNMLLLADRWLFERLSREVRVYQPKEGV